MVSDSDLAPLSENEPCDVSQTTQKNCTSDTETVQSETGQKGHVCHNATESNETVDLQDQPPQVLGRLGFDGLLIVSENVYLFIVCRSHF